MPGHHTYTRGDPSRAGLVPVQRGWAVAGAVVMANCTCKVGACSTCSSTCRRCGCGCDGVDPQVAKSRKSGAQPKESRRKSSKGKSKQRLAAMDAEVAVKNDAIALGRGEADLAEAQTDADNKSPLTRVWEFFGFTEGQRKKLPSRAAAKAGLVDKNSSAWYAMVQSFLTAATRVAEVLYPGNVQDLLLAVASRIRGSERPEVELERAADRVTEVMRKAPKNNMQRRVARAIFWKSFSRVEIKKICERRGVKLGGWSRGAGYEDYNKMTRGELLVPVKWQVQNYNEDTAKAAVRFILQPKMVGAMSWGVRKVHLSAEECVELPMLVRRRSVKDMYDEYVAKYSEKSSRISRGSF